ncbi:hypothetical protein BB558_007612 [Smittium angustum]|uniref:Uncharacterized protein n=1 Tax=Smittium angustum TaxID=133377 RepID=A0A2U1IUL4_SMIAN|nr:hypothetical protein BB558_007591 [Smittium angustum]PVZ96504.1 hypothetical protein BB558_007612 [Smittium angustum]
MYHYSIDNIIKLGPDDKNITLKAKVILNEETGTVIAQGVSNLGTNVGLGVCVSGLSASAAKVLGKSSIPPFQKLGLVVMSGALGGAIHTATTVGDPNIKTSGINNLGSLPKNTNSLFLMNPN